MTGETDITVRDAQPADADDLVRLYGQLADGSEDAMPADAATTRALLARIASQPGRSLLVATRDGQVVGTADALVVDNLTHAGRPWAIVENVVVDERDQRHGAGQALMAEVVRRSRQAGCYKVQLLSRKVRTGAHRFYEALGFQATAEGFRRYLD